MKSSRSLPSWKFVRSAVILLLAASGAGTSRGQQVGSGGGPAGASTPAKTQKLANLTGRYRFSERYTSDDEHTGPGLVGSCRVAVLEVVKDSFDTTQGAPKRLESSRQAIFTERPAVMGDQGVVTSTTRTFEAYRARPEDSSKMMGPRPLDGLSVLVRPRSGELPLIVNLGEGRPLTEYEYEVISRQVVVPQLVSLLPPQGVRIGDTWRVPRRAAQALLGDPWIQGDSLVGKLSEVRKEVDGPRSVASIAISGRVVGPMGDTTINAEVVFTFLADSSLKAFSTKPTFPPRPTEDLIEAKGAITELRLARVTTGPLPGPGRLRFQSNRELTVHRQLGLGAGGPAPPLVEKTPELTEANSWLTHVDSTGRYSLRHPQDLLSPDRTQPAPETNTILLIRTRREGRDMLQVEFVGKTLSPEDLRKELKEKYQALKMEVIPGEEGWLPEADWPRMRVHRIEAAVKVADAKAAATVGSTRIHFDGYLLLFGQSASVMAVATTSKDSVASFRGEVDQILKSVQINPGKPPVE